MTQLASYLHINPDSNTIKLSFLNQSLATHLAIGAILHRVFFRRMFFTLHVFGLLLHIHRIALHTTTSTCRPICKHGGARELMQRYAMLHPIHFPFNLQTIHLDYNFYWIGLLQSYLPRWAYNACLPTAFLAFTFRTTPRQLLQRHAFLHDMPYFTMRLRLPLILYTCL